MSDFNLTLNSYVQRINVLLIRSLPTCNYGVPTVCDAMEYSLNIGGKRIRPILVYEFNKLCGGDINLSDSPAKAIEMIHTYSLIHDDLPCMDNDDLRRGKPSCHIQFGESYALLAGDALLTQAFTELSSGLLAQRFPSRALECIRLLSLYSGVLGMIGGQTIDLNNENKSVDVNGLALTDKLKTGALIKSACLLGVVSAGGSKEDVENAEIYAEHIGQAFQIIDDILDVTGDEAKLGKPIFSDEHNNKSTYVSLYGIGEARRLVDFHTQEAVKAISFYGEKSDFLVNLANYLSKRVY